MAKKDGKSTGSKPAARSSAELSSQELAEQAAAELGRKVNLNSPKQLQEAIFGQLGLPRPAERASGGFLTGTAALRVLQIDSPHRFVDLVLHYREAVKRERRGDGTPGRLTLKDLLTIEEIAELMDVLPQTVRVYAIRDEDFPPVAAYVGRSPLRSKRAVLRYLKIREVRNTGKSGRIPRPVRIREQ